MTTQSKKPTTATDPFLDDNGLFKHIQMYNEDAYPALKMLIARLPEPQRSMFVSEALRQSIDFCANYHLLSKLEPLCIKRIEATSRKHGLDFYIRDPLKDGFWMKLPDSHHYFYLKMLLVRLPPQVRSTISTRLMLILLKGIPSIEALLPFKPEMCKLKMSTTDDTHCNAPLVTPTPIDPLSDPLNNDTFWSTVHPDNVYPLLKQLLARCPPDTKKTLCLKMLKSCIGYLSDKHILAPYDPSKANHLPNDDVSMQTSGKTFILPTPKQTSPSESGANTQQCFSSSTASLAENVERDHSSLNKIDSKASSPATLPDTADRYRDIVWTRSVSQQQLVNKPNSSLDSTLPPREHEYIYLTDSTVCNLADVSEKFTWTRTPSEYYRSDSPLPLADVSGFSLNFSWTQPPSEEGGVKQGDSNYKHNEFTRDSENVGLFCSSACPKVLQFDS